jgi:hypothetical protein
VRSTVPVGGGRLPLALKHPNVKGSNMKTNTQQKMTHWLYIAVVAGFQGGCAYDVATTQRPSASPPAMMSAEDIVGTPVTSQPPSSLAHLRLPSGTSFVIEEAVPPVQKSRQLGIKVKYSRSAQEPATSEPDSLGIFYLTANADLTAPETEAVNLSTATGLAKFWREIVEKTGKTVPFTAHNRNHQLCGGIATLQASGQQSSGESVSIGSSDIPLESVSPPVLAVVLLRNGKPASNVFWLPVTLSH